MTTAQEIDDAINHSVEKGRPRSDWALICYGLLRIAEALDHMSTIREDELADKIAARLRAEFACDT